MYSEKYRMEIERVDLEQLVSDQIPDYASYPKDKKFRIKCPHCRQEKSPAMSVLRNLRVGICFRCEILFVNDDTEGELKSEDIESSLYGIRNVEKHQGLQAIDDSVFDLFEPAKDNEFLNHRNPYIPDWNYYGIKQAPNKVITPYFLFGNLVYYQIRRYNPRGFQNPTGIEAPIYIPSNVRKAPGRWYPDAPTVIGEGPFSMIAYDCVRRYSGKKFNIAGLGGKVMTDYRENLLKMLGLGDVTLNLDETKLSQELRLDMIHRRLGRRINIVPSTGLDPEEELNRMGLQRFTDFVLPYIFENSIWKENVLTTPDANATMVDTKLKL